MKHLHSVFLVALVVLGLSIPMMALALGDQAFGAYFMMTQQAPVICNGIGPITGRSVGTQASLPWSIMPSVTPWVGSAQNGVWALGFVSRVTDTTTCYIQAGPVRIPYSTTAITKYGTGRAGF